MLFSLQCLFQFHFFKVKRILIHSVNKTYFVLHLHFRDVSIPQPYQQFFSTFCAVLSQRRDPSCLMGCSSYRLANSSRHSSFATTAAATSTRFSETSQDPQEGGLCSQDDAFDMG
ncbi:hypothetical protein CDAR_510331 [Caerostris darwini]|uniref:Uncharacterized protein n=1 Tax=Caerostris darwini TaxID=1538125 RepID=A0AAV4UYG1_9ARAC|nr:hypothetical protein CDAR_510331 [Caerostris darwini]